jgi:hypothetical protein
VPLDPTRDHVNRTIRTIELAALMRRTIMLSCSRCRHQRLLDARALWWLFHQRRWADGLPIATERFYCAACWRRDHKRYRPGYQITDETPVGDQFPEPDEREWKRLVARFRS